MTSAIHWTVEDVATYYGVSKRAIYHAIEKGALPAIQVGGALRVRREAALDYGRPVNDSPSVQSVHPLRVVSTTA